MAILTPTAYYKSTGVEPVTDGLVQWLDAGLTNSYPGFNNTWIDIAPGASRSWTLSNNPTHVAGTNGYFQFNGSNQYAAGTNGDTIITLGANIKFTFEAVCETDTLSGYRAIQSFWEGGGFTGQIWWLGKGGNAPTDGWHNALRYQGGTPDREFNDWAAGLFVIGTYTHVIATYDFSSGTGGTFNIYKNGNTTPFATITTTMAGVQGDGTNNAEPDIGRQSSGASYWDGEIAAVRMYDDKILSADEITQQHQYWLNRGYTF